MREKDKGKIKKTVMRSGRTLGRPAISFQLSETPEGIKYDTAKRVFEDVRGAIIKGKPYTIQLSSNVEVTATWSGRSKGIRAIELTPGKSYEAILLKGTEERSEPGCQIMIIQIVDQTLTYDQISMLLLALKSDLESGKGSIITVPISMRMKIYQIDRAIGCRINQYYDSGDYEVYIYAGKQVAGQSILDIQEASQIIGIDGKPFKRHG